MRKRLKNYTVCINNNYETKSTKKTNQRGDL